MYKRVVHILAWFFLCLTVLGNIGGAVFDSFEKPWRRAEGVVQHGGQEVVYTTSHGETHVLLHLSPPEGAPAWQDGERVKLIYYLAQPEHARLGDELPPRFSDWLYAIGFGSLIPALVLGALAMPGLRRSEGSTAPSPRPCSRVGWFFLALIWGLRAAACLCALGVVVLSFCLLAAIVCDPDPNSIVVGCLVEGTFFMACGACLWGVSSLLRRTLPS